MISESTSLDPRSANINTEAGLYIESPELAQRVIAYMNEGVEPENSYRVRLDTDEDLIWITEIDGKEVRYHNEPETSFWQRFMSRCIEMLTVEHQMRSKMSSPVRFSGAITRSTP